MLKIIKDNDVIKVKSSYNERFVKLSKALGGKWASPYWCFASENEEKVRELCLKIYGDNGLNFEKVDLTIDLNVAEKLYFDNAIKIGDVILCERVCNEWNVKFADNVIVIEGEFCSRGGSAKHPRVTWNSDEMKIKVKGFPKELFEQLEDKTGIIATKSATDIEKLLQEKETLLKRLAEIEKMLGDAENDL